MNTNGFDHSPIRRYKKQKQAGGLRLAAILAMTAVLVVAVSVLIMSIAGIGLFADRKEPVGSETSPVGGSEPEDTEAPADTSEPEDTTPPTTEPPAPVDPNAIQYTYVDKGFNAVGEGLLTLISAKHLYKFPTSAVGNLDSVFEYGNSSKYHYEVNDLNDRLDYRAVEALNAMAEAFTAETGSANKLLLSEAYRDFDKQKALYDKNPKDAAIPGGSDYHSGATLYLASWDAENKQVVSLSGEEAQWLRANAHKYGFIFRSPASKAAIIGYSPIDWQLRYVGLPHAQYMYEHDLCLEEYLEKLANDHLYAGDHLQVAGVDGKMYEIFYVQASEDGIIRLPIPSNRKYVISGDNIGGFIVTVTVGNVTEVQ